MRTSVGMLAVLLAGVLTLGGTLWVSSQHTLEAAPAMYAADGGYVTTGSLSFGLAELTFDQNGVHGYVLLDDEVARFTSVSATVELSWINTATGALSYTTLAVSPTLTAASDQFAWAIGSMPFPAGTEFYGSRITGSFVTYGGLNVPLFAEVGAHL